MKFICEAGWCRVKANCSDLGPGSVGGLSRDPSPYLREFRGKPWETPNDYLDKRDQGLNYL